MTYSHTSQNSFICVTCVVPPTVAMSGWSRFRGVCEREREKERRWNQKGNVTVSMSGFSWFRAVCVCERERERETDKVGRSVRVVTISNCVCVCVCVYASKRKNIAVSV